MTSILNISEPMNVADKSRFQSRSSSKWQKAYDKINLLKSGQAIEIKLNSITDAKSLSSNVYSKYCGKAPAGSKPLVVRQRELMVTIYKK